MRILLSTIGSRGDVQPLLGLALALRTLGQQAHFCTPPDFRDWLEGFGFGVTPIGPSLRETGKAGAPSVPVEPDRMRALMAQTITGQIDTLLQAADGCDGMMGATALQIAAPSVAEHLGIPYRFTAFSPNVLPSAQHAPPLLTALGDRPAAADADLQALWQQDAMRWNAMWLEPLNAGRDRLKLPALTDVRSHVLTSTPWLAADPALAPAPDDTGARQTGAWLLPDETPLSTELEDFLAAGAAPVYFGFGSIRATPGLAEAAVGAARALGQRVILAAGWADLSLPDQQPDCLAIGEVNQQHLFPRVAAVVHHGGAGTTTAAARAGAAQVIVPQLYDQPYWAQRVQSLGIGIAHAIGAPDRDSLTRALQACLERKVTEAARRFAGQVRGDGAALAAAQLVAEFSGEAGRR